MIQSLTYFHTIFVTLIGLLVFGEVLELHVAFGGGVVIASGLFTL